MRWYSLLLCLFCCGVHAQQKTQLDHSRIIDELAGIQEDDADYETVYENLMQLLAHPADLNTVSAEELRQFHILSDQQVKDLIEHRQVNGQLLSIYELQSIPSFSLETIERIQPFLQVADPNEKLDRRFLGNIFSKDDQYLITRWERTLEEKEGSKTQNSDQTYLGSRDKFYMRFRSSRPGQFSAGFTVENDPGEKFRWQPVKRRFGVDFNSTHVQILNRGRIKNAILGDYQAQIGQGLIFGGAFGLGKGGETILTTRRNNIGFVPHTSAGEAGFFRGAAATVELKRNFYTSFLWSNTKRDGTLKDSEDGSRISSLNGSGFHRNRNELDNERTVSENLMGAAIEYKSRLLSIGVIGQHVGFDKEISPDTSVYNQFVFRGRTNTNVGVHFNAPLHNINLFGEAAYSLTHGTGMVLGMIAALDSKTDVAVVIRNYSRNFKPFYSNPFSENTQPVNEIGYYLGWKYVWNRRLNTTGYVDVFRFPWISFRRYQPSTGYEALIRLNYAPSKKVSMFVQARQESKERNQSHETHAFTVKRGVKENYSFSVSFNAADFLTLRSRVQYSQLSFPEKYSDGFAAAQMLSAKFGRFQFTGMYALFDTDDFDNRQYMYENDVQLAFSLPAYDGTGVRTFLMAEYKMASWVTVWIRYARTEYRNVEEIGTGLESISGNIRNDVKLQSIFRF